MVEYLAIFEVKLKPKTTFEKYVCEVWIKAHTLHIDIPIFSVLLLEMPYNFILASLSKLFTHIHESLFPASICSMIYSLCFGVDKLLS